MMFVLDMLKAIAAKKPADVTAEDKHFVTRLAEGLKIEIKTKTKCGACWIDAAVVLYNHLNKAKEAAHAAACDYVLADGVDVWFGSQRVNAQTITNEFAADILSRGFSPSYFVKIPNKAK